MSASSDPRILLIGENPESCRRARQKLDVPERRNAADSRLAPLLGSLLEGVRVDRVDSPRQGFARVRRAIAEGRPYALTWVARAAADRRGHFDDNDGRWIERLLDADPELAVVVCAEGYEGATNLAAGERTTPGRLYVLPWPPDAAWVRSWLALLIDHRRVRRHLDRTTVDLVATRRALDHARDEVERAARAKNEFVSNISHEIRTPMNAILGFSGLLLKEPLSDDQRKKVGYVHEAGQSLLRLMNHLLDFSRLVTGTVKLHPSAFHFDEVIHGVVDEVLPAARAKGLTLRCHVEEAVPAWLRGDKTRLRQILLNLLDNAVKFTEQGSIHLSATVDEETDDAATLRVTVTDTGVGIPADLRDVVFDGFSQADGSSTRSFEGVGVGLAISKRLVDMMGGQIGLRSGAGEGSTFWFTVTLEKHSARRRRGSPATSPTGAEPPLSCLDAAEPSTLRQRPQVLVAEDDRFHRTLIDAMLGQGGCVVDLVANGREALGVLRKNTYDLVFMDVGLPEMDGLEAIRNVRRREITTGGHVPIVAIADDTPGADRRQCFEAGADQYLLKPLSTETLLAITRQYVPVPA
jgi:signal transduction histidine kinase/ActR/RegA family two-component response regulator